MGDIFTITLPGGSPGEVLTHVCTATGRVRYQVRGRGVAGSFTFVPIPDADGAAASGWVFVQYGHDPDQHPAYHRYRRLQDAPLVRRILLFGGGQVIADPQARLDGALLAPQRIGALGAPSDAPPATAQLTAAIIIQLRRHWASRDDLPALWRAALAHLAPQQIADLETNLIPAAVQRRDQAQASLNTNGRRLAALKALLPEEGQVGS
ncbi:hypothetical protein GCM10010123_02260 [Pilimelia anulata]|uniref:Uncharacterized protein n=1 Tax=Pilimelia anulata TaxID=53371 RepID=A0A8J3B3F5_9ACTN|nr:hypothetical protein [Pilimelia anulata]GGJ75869.1 hypothetical protein GCM10010123_02260 [Pilimelia anulata]